MAPRRDHDPCVHSTRRPRARLRARGGRVGTVRRAQPRNGSWHLIDRPGARRRRDAPGRLRHRRWARHGVRPRTPSGGHDRNVPLESPHGVNLDGFGAALTLDGDRMAVGAPFAFAPGLPGGAAYVFPDADLEHDARSGHRVPVKRRRGPRDRPLPRKARPSVEAHAHAVREVRRRSRVVVAEPGLEVPGIASHQAHVTRRRRNESEVDLHRELTRRPRVQHVLDVSPEVVPHTQAQVALRSRRAEEALTGAREKIAELGCGKGRRCQVKVIR
ncbi:MAG: hypothetical protein GY711_03925 [bacterium]|nr:hypothetical protein [bacterium]